MKKLSKTKKIILTILTVVVLVVIGIFVSVPILDNIDHSNFEKLNKHQTSIYDRLVATSGGLDAWKYLASCIEVYAGSWPTGEFTCSTVISTEKQVSSANELNQLQSKYFNIIDQDPGLQQISELNIQSPQDFGKKFVVSSAEKHYTDRESGVSCKYILALDQLQENTINFTYGTKIMGDNGKVTVTLSCSHTAREAWYQVIK